MSEGRQGAYGLEETEAVQAGHHDVGNDQLGQLLRRRGAQEVEGRLSVRGLDDLRGRSKVTYEKK